MPVCPKSAFDHFMALLEAVNPTIKSGLKASIFGKSALQPLVALLNDPGCTAEKLCLAVEALPPATVAKYGIPLNYVLANFPRLTLSGIRVEDVRNQPIRQAEAAIFRKSPMPPGFHPDNSKGKGVFVIPPSAFLGMSIVKCLLTDPKDTGLLLIHLGHAKSNGLEERFNGRTTLEYMTSVLRVARLVDCPVTVLSMAKDGEEHLCPVLLREFMLVDPPRRLVIHEPKLHTATNNPAMVEFLQRQKRLVVMGFDATICVFANVFGSMERMGGLDERLRPPLLTFADVIMSRATLACKGLLDAKTPSVGRKEYGPLFQLGPN